MSKKPQKITISLAATKGRINRKLKQINRKLKQGDLKFYANQAQVNREAVGDYYVVNTATGKIVATHLDIEKYAHEVGALHPWETLER